MDQIKSALCRHAFKETYRLFRGVRRIAGSGRPQGGKRPLKIFTNVQTSVVGGISRVMSSFSDYLQSEGREKIELVCASLAPASVRRPDSPWQKTVDAERGTTALSYQGDYPLFGSALQESAHVDDVRNKFSGLVDAFHVQLKEEKPDVVMLNGTYFVPWCLMTAARMMRLPTILYYHGSLTKETEHWEDEKKKRIVRGIEASFYRRDIKYIFPSALIKAFVEKKIFGHRLYQKRAIVLSNPIPEAFFAARESLDNRSVGFVGRWTRIKNTAFLQRFADFNFQNRYPMDIQVVTDEASKTRAKKILHDRVVFVEPMDAAVEMANFYAKMSAVICPSRFETYGNVAQESVAAGTPAFVSRNMGIAEVFKRIGLENLILDFSNPQRVHAAVQNGFVIRPEARRALREEAGASIVHKKLLEYIKA